MTKVIFQRREETEQSLKYPNLMPPWVEKFRGEVSVHELGRERLAFIAFKSCDELDIDPYGEWQVLAFFKSGRKVLYLGEIY